MEGADLVTALGAALGAVHDGVAVFGPDWTIRYINAAGAAVLDRDVTALVGVNMWEAFPEAVDTEFHTCLVAAAANGPGAEPVQWSAYYGPVQGWFTDQAWRVGELVVVVYTRADDARQAEATRQRLTAEVQEALLRSQLLLTASEAFNSAVNLAEVEDAAAGLLAEDVNPPTYVDLVLLEPDGRHLTRVRPDTLPPDIRPLYRRMRLDADLPGPQSVRTGSGVFLPDLAAVADRYPQLHADWAAPDRQAMASVPLRGPDDLLGALLFVWPQPRNLDVGAQALLTAVAGYAGHAVARLRAQERRVAAAQARYEDTRAAMLAMQRTLLAELPVLPGLRVEAHYLPAEDDQAAGGDWFDVIPLDDGRVALVVGDVVGHGAAAAATMGRLRTITEHLFADGTELPDVAAAMDRFAARVDAARAATVCLAVLDPVTGELEWITRGHPPPLLVDQHDAWFLTSDVPTGHSSDAGERGDGEADVVGRSSGGVLGVGATPGPVRHAHVPAGATLLLYTDGLVESRDGDLETGLRRLRDATAARVLPGADNPSGHEPAQLARQVLDAMGAAGFGDDVTVLAVRQSAPHPQLALDLDAEPIALRQALAAFNDWIAALNLDPDDADGLVLAIGEAVTNAVEHAYPRSAHAQDDTVGASPRVVTLRARLGRDGVLRATVADRGRWRSPAAEPGPRGRGMQMMRLLIDEVTVEHDHTGTRVHLGQRLSRPAVFGIAPRPVSSVSSVEFGSHVDRGDGLVRVRVHGPIDTTTVEDLRRDVVGASRGGAVSVLLDLGEVTQLASAGVALLHDLRHQLDLRIHLPAGGVTARVLALTGLDDLLVHNPVAGGVVIR